MQIPKELNPDKFGRRTASKVAEKAVKSLSFNTKVAFIEGVPFGIVCKALIKLNDDTLSDLLLGFHNIITDKKECSRLGNPEKIKNSYKQKILTLSKLMLKKGKVIPQVIIDNYL